MCFASGQRRKGGWLKDNPKKKNGGGKKTINDNNDKEALITKQHHAWWRSFLWGLENVFDLSANLLVFLLHVWSAEFLLVIHARRHADQSTQDKVLVEVCKKKPGCKAFDKRL